MSAGIQKLSVFYTVLKMLAARTGNEIQYTAISNNAGGVSSVTVKEWVGLLERSNLIYLLRPYSNNLNKRLTKTPKLYFLDTGLATRLQGWSEEIPLLTSPQIGALFESLVLAEIVKFITNYSKDWELFFWRTKEGEEIDFIVKTADQSIYAFEAKFAIQGFSRTLSYPKSFLKDLSPKNPLIIVTSGGEHMELSQHCSVLPIQKLHQYLLEIKS